MLGEQLKRIKARIERLRKLGPKGLLEEAKKEPHYWMRILRHTFRLFMDNRGPYQANALAYRSMVSMVPIFALIVSMMTLIMGSKPTQTSRYVKEKAEEMIAGDTAGVFAGDTAAIKDADTVSGGLANGGTAGGKFKLGGHLPTPSDLGLQDKDIYDDIAGNFLETVLPDFPEREDIMDQIKPHVANFVEQARKGAVIGFLVLFLASIFLINAIETIFNNIWHISRRRAYSFRVLAYTALTFLIPVLLGMSIYITAIFSAEDFLNALANSQIIRAIPPLQWTLERTTGMISGIGLPVAIVWMLFLAMYKWLPNTKVDFRAALITSLLVAVAFEFCKYGFSFLAGKMVSSRQIWWGSLGVFLVFLVWVYFIWWIVLFGAQMTYVIQNYRYVFRKGHQLEGRVGDAYLACRVMLEIAKAHSGSRQVPTVRDLAERIEVEVPRIQKVLSKLTDANLVILGAHTGNRRHDEEVYVPGRDLSKITIADVVHTVTDVWQKPTPEFHSHSHGADGEPLPTESAPDLALEEILDQKLDLANIGLKVSFREILETEKTILLAGDTAAEEA